MDNTGGVSVGYNWCMTGRTHDLAAFTAMTMILAYQPIIDISLGTAIVAFGANMLGGLAPDMDNATSDIWRKVRGGSILARIIQPLTGGHRLISHSLVGVWLVGKILMWLLVRMSTVLLVDIHIVWWAFMLGYISHLVTDTITKEGVPWLFPIPIRFGFPPFKALRITTGELMEKAFIFPGLLLLNGYIIYQNYGKFLEIIHHIK